MTFETFHFLRPAWLLALFVLPAIVWLALRATARDVAWSTASTAEPPRKENPAHDLASPTPLRPTVLPGREWNAKQ